MNRRIFVPICLYASAQFRRRKEIRFVLEQIETGEALLLVADFLHSYYLAITKDYLPFEQCINRAMNAGENVYRMINNVCKATGRTDVSLCRWKDLSERVGYVSLRARIDELYRGWEPFRQNIDVFAERNLEVFGRGGDSVAAAWEKEYLLSEVSMSLFVTEVLGFSVEVWERRPRLKSPGPLEFLYGSGREELRKILKEKPNREVLFLEEWVLARNCAQKRAG